LIGFLNTGQAAAMGITLMAIALAVTYSARIFSGRSEKNRV